MGNNKRRVWTAAEDDLLRSLWESGVNSFRIRATLRRNWTAVYKRVRGLGLQRPGVKTDGMPRNENPWTDEIDAMIIKLRADGLPYSQIGRAIGRPWNAVRARLIKIGALPATQRANLHRCLYHIHGCKKMVDRSRGEWICRQCKAVQSGYAEINGRVLT